MTNLEIKQMVKKTMEGQGNQVDLGGKLPFIIGAILDNIEVTEFIPKVAFETEEISMGDAATKYGLTDEAFGKLTKGETEWLALGATDESKRLKVIAREEDKYILCGGIDGETDLQASITLTEDGNFNIVIPS